ncbi:MAG: DUF89 family protein [Candidatus Omnitrophica bacterium]|nr:DUF89 family protein [Candidatus Omnitrophota bacterium]
MKTYLECIPCFFKQAIEASSFAGANHKHIRALLNELSRHVPRLSLAKSPPEMGKVIYGLVRKHTGRDDPFAKVKRESNSIVMREYNLIKDKVRCSKDGLLTAVELAIAGNIIDYGVASRLDVSKEVDRILSQEKRVIEDEGERLFNYRQFKRLLKNAKHILYIADNAGEIVFDKILIEEIKSMYPDKTIVVAVKERPIINDALKKDAAQCGLDRIVKVISSGMDIPGTILGLCSKEFLRAYKNADMIISKGQGNFEALSEKDKDLFSLFMAKCPVVARDIGCDIGAVILSYNKQRHRPVRNR